MNNEIIGYAEEASEIKLDSFKMNADISLIKKMLKNGFNPPIKNVPIIDEKNFKKTKSLIDKFANFIKFCWLTDNFEKINDYLKIYHGIEINFYHSFKYNETPKKSQKFREDFERFYYQKPDLDPEKSLKVLINSIIRINSQIKDNKENLKGIINEIKENEESSIIIFNTLVKILFEAKKKGLDPKLVAEEIEEILGEQEKAINLIQEEENFSDENE